MRDSDRLIEKVLAGLRDAEAPAGMERRILDRMQSRAASSVQENWLRGLGASPVLRPMACAAVVACVAAVLLAIPVVKHQRQHALIQATKAMTLPSPSTATPLPGEAMNTEPQNPPVIVRVSRKRRPAAAEKIVDSQESLAAREMKAPSRTAPPLPLTEQEKLLVRFVRTSTPEQLAAVDPAKGAADDEQEKEEFDSFFRRFPKKQAVKVYSVKEQPAKEKPTEEAMNRF